MVVRFWLCVLFLCLVFFYCLVCVCVKVVVWCLCFLGLVVVVVVVLCWIFGEWWWWCFGVRRSEYLLWFFCWCWVLCVLGWSRCVEGENLVLGLSYLFFYLVRLLIWVNLDLGWGCLWVFCCCCFFGGGFFFFCFLWLWFSFIGLVNF